MPCKLRTPGPVHAVSLAHKRQSYARYGVRCPLLRRRVAIRWPAWCGPVISRRCCAPLPMLCASTTRRPRVNDTVRVNAPLTARSSTRHRDAGPADNLKIYMRFVADYRRNWLQFGIAFSLRIGKLTVGATPRRGENSTGAFQRKVAPLATGRVGHFGRWIEDFCTQNTQFKFSDHLQCT